MGRYPDLEQQPAQLWNAFGQPVLSCLHHEKHTPDDFEDLPDVWCDPAEQGLLGVVLTVATLADDRLPLEASCGEECDCLDVLFGETVGLLATAASTAAEVALLAALLVDSDGTF